MATHYNVIFEGKTLPGMDAERARGILMNALKLDANAIERLFSGERVVIKKKADAATAEKFKKVFAAAGAVCTLDPLEDFTVPEPHSNLQMEEAEPLKAMERTASKSNRSLDASNGRKIVVTNIETVPGKTIVEHFGLVSGSTIRAKHLGKDLMASLKNLVGGELKGYTQLLNESRQQALERMIEQATQLGANAIVNVRFSTSSVAQGAAELYAYGTAVFVE